MDYEKALQHYLERDETCLVCEAIATLENWFDNIPKHELYHQSRVSAISYLALKQIQGTHECGKCKA